VGGVDEADDDRIGNVEYRGGGREKKGVLGAGVKRAWSFCRSRGKRENTCNLKKRERGPSSTERGNPSSRRSSYPPPGGKSSLAPRRGTGESLSGGECGKKKEPAHGKEKSEGCP